MPGQAGVSSQGPLTVREFCRARQRKRLIRNSSVQLLVTAVLRVLSAIVLLAYCKTLKPILSDTYQRIFGALITALQISIGVDVASSLGSYAKMLRWRILASSDWSFREFDLILNCAEQRNVLKLLWLSRGPGCCR